MKTRAAAWTPNHAYDFEPFFNTRAPGYSNGLALATVEGIVLQSGGAAEVESKPESGTIFRVYLPRVAQPADTPESVPRSEPGAVPKTTLLLAEDESKVRTVMLRILSRLGHEVLVAEDGAQALEIARAHRDLSPYRHRRGDAAADGARAVRP